MVPVGPMYTMLPRLILRRGPTREIVRVGFSCRLGCGSVWHGAPVVRSFHLALIDLVPLASPSAPPPGKNIPSWLMLDRGSAPIRGGDPLLLASPSGLPWRERHVVTNRGDEETRLSSERLKGGFFKTLTRRSSQRATARSDDIANRLPLFLEPRYTIEDACTPSLGYRPPEEFESRVCSLKPSTGQSSQPPLSTLGGSLQTHERDCAGLGLRFRHRVSFRLNKSADVVRSFELALIDLVPLATPSAIPRHGRATVRHARPLRPRAQSRPPSSPSRVGR